MFRTHTCGELRISDVNKQITLSGWVQRSRKMGGMTFIDLRDRYGITQLVFNEEINAELCDRANKLGREFVIQITGTVNERFSKNANIPTGDIEIIVSELNVLNTAMTPPFTIEDNTDGGDDIRMKYRYLDLRRNAVRSNLELRHKMTIEVRKYLDSLGFIEVETPVLIGSTPEGARDFVVPSRMNPGQFYALPQSPQTLKQLLMVSGFDRYFQIAKCFRDEDLRADRQPEFTPKASAAIIKTSARYCPMIPAFPMPRERNTPVSCIRLLPHMISTSERMTALTSTITQMMDDTSACSFCKGAAASR